MFRQPLPVALPVRSAPAVHATELANMALDAVLQGAMTNKNKH
jgi:hypothetical protein